MTNVLTTTAKGFYKPASGHYDFNDKDTKAAIEKVIKEENGSRGEDSPYYVTVSEASYNESRGEDVVYVRSEVFGLIATIGSYDGAKAEPSEGVYKSGLTYRINEALSNAIEKQVK